MGDTQGNAKAAPTDKLWSKYFILLFGAGLFSNFCLQCTTTVKTLYITSIGGTTSFVGMLSIVGLISISLARLASGRMSDVMRKRVVAYIGIAINIVAKLCFGFFPVLALFIPFQIIQNIGFSMSATAMTVLVADTIPRSRMSEGIGYNGLSNSLATAIGPTVALATVAAFGYVMLFGSLAVYLAISALFILFCRYEKDPKMIAMRKREEEEFDSKTAAGAEDGGTKAVAQYTGIKKFVEPSAIPYAIVSLLYSLPMGFTLSYLPLYATESGITAIGIFFTISAVAMVVSRLAAGKAADKYGTLTVVVPAIILYIAVYVLILIAPSAPTYVIWLAGACYGFAGGIIHPVLNAIVIRQVPHERRGAASGTFTLSFDVGISGGSAIWGFTIQYIGYGFTISACIVIGFVMLAASFLLLRDRGKTKTA